VSWGFLGSEDSSRGHLGCDAVYCCSRIRTVFFNPVECTSVLYVCVTECYSMGLGPLPPFSGGTGGGAGTTPASPAAPATPNPAQGTDTPASPGTETTASSTPTATTTTSTAPTTGTSPSQASNPQQDVFSQFMARMVCIYYIYIPYFVASLLNVIFFTELPHFFFYFYFLHI